MFEIYQLSRFSDKSKSCDSRELLLFSFLEILDTLFYLFLYHFLPTCFPSFCPHQNYSTIRSCLTFFSSLPSRFFLHVQGRSTRARQPGSYLLLRPFHDSHLGPFFFSTRADFNFLLRLFSWTDWNFFIPSFLLLILTLMFIHEFFFLTIFSQDIPKLNFWGSNFKILIFSIDFLKIMSTKK